MKNISEKFLKFNSRPLAENICRELALPLDEQVLVILQTGLENAWLVGYDDGKESGFLRTVKNG